MRKTVGVSSTDSNLFAVCPGGSYLTSLDLRPLICKMEIQHTPQVIVMVE